MDHVVLRSVNVFMAAYILIFAISVLLIGIDNFDLVTNFTAVAATLNNIGPGLELVGPAQNFGLFSNFSKLVLTFDMLPDVWSCSAAAAFLSGYVEEILIIYKHFR